MPSQMACSTEETRRIRTGRGLPRVSSAGQGPSLARTTPLTSPVPVGAGPVLSLRLRLLSLMLLCLAVRTPHTYALCDRPDFDSSWIVLTSTTPVGSFAEVPHGLGGYPAQVTVAYRGDTDPGIALEAQVM